MIHTVLSEYEVPFYMALGDGDKERFQYRVRDYLKGRQIKGPQAGEVDDAIKILIAAAAVTLTFAVHKFWYPYFNLILLREGDYLELIRKRYQRDRLRMQGAIVIAKEQLIEASRQPDRVLHPGFHEFAHAVYHENAIEGEGYMDITERQCREQMNVHAGAMKGFDLLPPELLEKSAVYPQQFFASAMLWHFSRPGEFKSDAPELSDWLHAVITIEKHSNHEKATRPH